MQTSELKLKITEFHTIDQLYCEKKNVCDYFQIKHSKFYIISYS